MKRLEELGLCIAREADKIGSMHSTQYGGMPTRLELDANLEELLLASLVATTSDQRRSALLKLAARSLFAVVLLDGCGR